jgi:hypothetical protein
MKRRSFLAFLGAVVPAASLAKMTEAPAPVPAEPKRIEFYSVRSLGSITVASCHTEYVTSSDTRRMWDMKG